MNENNRQHGDEESQVHQPLVESSPVSRRNESFRQENKERTIGYTIAGISMICLLLATLVFSIWTLTNVLVIMTKPQDFQGVVSYLYGNLLIDPISDILIEDEKECPEDYQIMTLAKWPGTNSGCYCPGTDQVIADCDANTQHGGQTCEPISEISSRDIFFWGKHTFCARYISKEYIVYEQECSEGSRNCGEHGCINNKFLCPITSVEYLAQAPATLTSDSSSRQFGDGVLMFGRSKEELPILNLQASQTDVPCLSVQHHPAKENFTYYPLLKTIPAGCGKYGTASSSQILGRKPERDLLLDNGMTQVVQFELKSYEKYIEGLENVLVARQKVGVERNEFCRQINPENFQATREGVKSNLQTISSLMLVIFGVALVEFSLLCCFWRKDVGFSLRKSGKNISFYVLIGLFVIVGGNCATYSFGIESHDQIRTHSDMLKEFSKASCFQGDKLVQALDEFNDTSADTLSTFQLTEISLLVSVFLFIGVVGGRIVARI